MILTGEQRWVYEYEVELFNKLANDAPKLTETDKTKIRTKRGLTCIITGAFFEA